MKEQVKKLWEEGKTDLEISKEIGISRRQVSRIRKNLGYISNNPKRVILNVEEIKTLLKDNSLTKIASLKGYSKDTLSTFAIKNKLAYSFNGGNNPKLPSTLEISKRQEEILVGTLLGDGYFSKRKNTPMFACTHGIKQKEYCKWKHSEFNSLNCIYKESIRKTPDKRNNKYYESASMRINCNTSFNKYYDLFYKDKVKYINKEILTMYSELSLAVHYMDDGTKLAGSYVICTQCFTQEDIQLYREFILSKWNIETTLHSNNTIYIKRKSKAIFESLILPYIHPTMMYKIYCPL